MEERIKRKKNGYSWNCFARLAAVKTKYASNKNVQMHGPSSTISYAHEVEIVEQKANITNNRYDLFILKL